MRIDVHNHFCLEEYARRTAGRTSLPSSSQKDGTWWVSCCAGMTIPFTPRMVDWETKIVDMDDEGIDVAVLSMGIPGPERLPPREAEDFAAYAHDELAQRIEMQPERFRGFATPGFGEMGRSLKELERCIDDLGFCGLQLFANIDGRTLDDPELRPFFARMHEYNLPIFIHPTIPLNRTATDDFRLMPSVGFLFDTTIAALRIIHAGIFDEFPGIKIILPHAGSMIPYLLGRIDSHSPGPEDTKITNKVSEQFANFYTDTVTYQQDAMNFCFNLVGADHLLYGSDYPFVPYDVTIRLVEGLPCTAEEREMIYCKNAENLLSSSFHGKV